MSSLTWPAVMKSRIGRPTLSVTACSLVFITPFVRPIRRHSPLCSNQWRTLAHPPLFTHRLVAVRWVFKSIASIIAVFSSGASAARPARIRANTALSRQRLQRL